MKRIILIAFISFFAIKGTAQTATFIGLYGGGGLALSNNYDVGISGGLDFMKGVKNRLSIGARLFYQGIGLVYDNEAYGAKKGIGNAGALLYNKSSYVFFTPKFDIGIRRLENVHFYATAGLGFNMGATESIRKWDNSYGAAYGNYDSTLNTSTNITSMVMRLGVGLTEYVYTGRHWRLTFSEDFGFIPQNISSTASYDNPSRTQYYPKSLNAQYFSLHIGLTHYGFHED